MFNDEGECGTGALVPWAGRLWIGSWAVYQAFTLAPGTHTFPDAFSAYWIRFRSNQACTASATLRYE